MKWDENKYHELPNSYTETFKIIVHLNLVAKFVVWMDQVIKLSGKVEEDVSESNEQQHRDLRQASALLMLGKKDNEAVEEFESLEMHRSGNIWAHQKKE